MLFILWDQFILLTRRYYISKLLYVQPSSRHFSNVCAKSKIPLSYLIECSSSIMKSISCSSAQEIPRAWGLSSIIAMLQTCFHRRQHHDLCLPTDTIIRTRLHTSAIRKPVTTEIEGSSFLNWRWFRGWPTADNPNTQGNPLNISYMYYISFLKDV